MKKLGIGTILMLALVLAACGSGNSNSNDVNGTWTATLTSPLSGQSVLTFTTSLTQNNSNTVSGTNLNFTTATPCFGAGATESGQIVLSGNTNGVTASALNLVVQWGPPGTSGSNTLTLAGTMKNNTIAGTWTLTGVTSGCSGNGTFTMTRM
jgi:hypothetical protein